MMRWIFSIKTKRMIVALLSSIISIALCVIIGGSFKSGAIFAFLFIVAGAFNVQILMPQNTWYYCIFPWFIIVSFFTLFLSQFIQNELLFSLPLLRVLLGGICCIVPMLGLFTITAKPRFSALIISTILLLLSTANYFVYNFRGSELCPADLFTISTALNVAGQYTYQLSNPLIYAWLLFGVFVLITTGLPALKIEKNLRYRCLAAFAGILLCLIFSVYSKRFPTQHFLHGGSFYNGYILNFTKEIPEIIVHKPKGYSTESVAQISEHYKNDVQQSMEHVPDIIVIMDEAYSDLSVLGNELRTDIPISPFINSLRKNTSFGYALTSAYGGGTPNSEYEFLTGNSLLFVNGIVYQQYLREPSYSLVSELKEDGYKCIAMHPYLANGWKRNTVWPNLMFDECIFQEGFPQENLIRGLVSDKEMFDVLIETYQEHKRNNDEPLFLFGVTMQNHSSYDYNGEDFQNSVHIEGYKNNYPDVEQYVSLIHETDKAVEYLLTQLETIDHDIVVLFYGDHQPALSEDFLREVHSGDFNTLDEKQLLQIVPFFIWTNYDSSSEEVQLTSLNFLSTRALQKAGIALPEYNRFLYEIEKQIPAMNVKGYYSNTDACFKEWADAEGEEKTVLSRYWMMEYNSLFDLKNLDPVFFPLKK